MADMVLSILNGQAKTLVMARPREDGLVYNFALCAASEFWETVARFAEPTATMRNIEHWRSVCALREQREEMALAAYEQQCAAERSARAQGCCEGLGQASNDRPAWEGGAMTDIQIPSEVIRQATENLSAQAARYMRAAQSLTKTALRLATIDDPVKVLQALAKYQQADLPEPGLAAEVAAMIEGTKSPERRAATEKRRSASMLYRMQRDLRWSGQDAVDLPPEIVLRIARERADTLGAAVDAIERRGDGSARSCISLPPT